MLSFFHRFLISVVVVVVGGGPFVRSIWLCFGQSPRNTQSSSFVKSIFFAKPEPIFVGIANNKNPPTTSFQCVLCVLWIKVSKLNNVRLSFEHKGREHKKWEKARKYKIRKMPYEWKFIRWLADWADFCAQTHGKSNRYVKTRDDMATGDRRNSIFRSTFLHKWVKLSFIDGRN